MNQIDLLFVTTALGVGAGLAFALGQKHGALAGTAGFVGGTAIVFIVLASVVAIARKPKGKRHREQQKDG
jgi:hypothetical protein